MLFITIQGDGFLGTALDKPSHPGCALRETLSSAAPFRTFGAHSHMDSSLLKYKDRLSLTLNKAK